MTPPKAGGERDRSTKAGRPTSKARPSESWPCPPASNRPAARRNCKELFEEQFRRPLEGHRLRHRRDPAGKLKKFFFEIDAELIVYGKTDPTAQRHAAERAGQAAAGRHVHDAVQPAGQPADHPRRRHGADGMEERTIVLAVERNTKHLDPMIHDAYGEQ